jgi:putative ABC transport system substrate-binding protein
MRRRAFIAGVAGATAAWPLVARGQQSATVGVLHTRAVDERAPEIVALRRGLVESGATEGRSIGFEFRWAEQRDRLPALAAELIGSPVSVIVANSIAAAAIKASGATVPIVFATGTDPVRDGLVASFNRPGGNITGISFLSGGSSGKRLELLRQLVPGAAVVGVIIDVRTIEGVNERRDLEAAAKAVGQQLFIVEVRSGREVEQAFASMAERKVGAVLIGSGAFLTTQQRSMAALGLRYRLPTVRNLREFAEAGWLMSYGTSITDAYRQAGVYAGRILKGEKPGDLPVPQATKFEFVVNLATAKAIGLDVPMHIHATADEVIE